MNGPINIGIVGFGTVGTGAVRILLRRQREFERRLGFPIILKRIADIDIERDRGIRLPEGMLIKDFKDILNDPDIHIVVELIGGINPAKDIILKAIERGKHVVTANKALLATEGEAIFRAAEANGVEVGFEASVAGGIPIIKIMRESLIGNDIHSIFGIINGTSNYVLTRMTDEGLDFSTALADAQRLGYAEADPTLDIEGIDSAHKLSILSTISFGIPFSFKKIYTEGITRLSPLDIRFAMELGYTIKLLAIAKQKGGYVEMRVHPTMLPSDHILSKVRGVYNAVFVEGDAIGQALFYGRGAGDMPTGSAVVSDIVDIARDINSCSSERIRGVGIPKRSGLKIKEMDDILTCYYLRFYAIDKPGVLSKISGILGSYNISIRSVIQKERKREKAVPLVMMTHRARERDVVNALKEINKLSVVSGKTLYIRVEEEGE
ncbi:MAG: homoserine dehydrogenase [Thermodesulfovibrionia bacterium]